MKIVDAILACRPICFVLGCFFLVIGIIGIILPMMPGLVNVLIALFFFARSSPRMEAWILNHRLLGPPVHNWRTHRCMTRRNKVMAITMMWAGITWGVIKAPLPGKICAVLLGIYGTWYIATRRETPVAAVATAA